MTDLSVTKEIFFEALFRAPYQDRDKIDLIAQEKLSPNLVKKITELLDEADVAIEKAPIGPVIIMPREPLRLSATKLKGCLADLELLNVDISEQREGSVRFLDPKDPDKGVLFFMFPLELSQIMSVRDLPWVRRLELPDVAWIENKNAGQ